ncbi:MAG: hypothetical protein JWN17_61 [Frankiales bacterium]|nr:hypothetical protein [Frankiales bacterium]
MDLPRRLGQLLVGLLLYGASLALLVRAGLGTSPWDVLHQGLSRTVGLSIGTWVVLLGAVLLLVWVPLRQRPGIGTVLNVLLVGTALDATLALLPAPSGWTPRVLLLLAGVGLNAVASATYIGAGLGPGPRDGLFLGVAALGLPVRRVRTAIEVTVLLVGIALGGTAGPGTLLYALAIGPLVQPLLPLLDLRRERVPAS